MRYFALVASVALSSAGAAQTGASTLSDRISSVRAGTTTEADCNRQVSQAENLNGPDLLYGASVCFAANRSVEGTFLLNAGQIRSIVDLALTVPASRADSDAQTSLYGFIYFQAGGAGSEEVLRTPALWDRFLSLLDGWSPRYAADYNPGWNVRRRPEAAEYESAVREQRADRRQQLTGVVRLYSDEIYYSLHRRFQELQIRNPGAFVEGTPEAELANNLLRQMNDRSIALGVGRQPSADSSDLSSARFPPDTPETQEEVLSGSTDPVARRCADLAERMTIAADSRIVRVLVTRSAEWGIIWRADLDGGDQPPQRFTCTNRTSSSHPMALGDRVLTPLPESRMPDARQE